MLSTTQHSVCEIRPKHWNCKSRCYKSFSIDAVPYTIFSEMLQEFRFSAMHWTRVNVIACSTIPIRKFNFVCAYINTNRHAHTHIHSHIVWCAMRCAALGAFCTVVVLVLCKHSFTAFARKDMYKKMNETNLKLKINKRANNRMRTQKYRIYCVLSALVHCRHSESKGKRTGLTKNDIT